MRNFATSNYIHSTENVTVGATSAQSSVAPPQIYRARVAAKTSDMWILVGANPTATTSSVFMPAGAVEYIDIRPGEKIAAIQDSAAGALNIAWLTS